MPVLAGLVTVGATRRSSARKVEGDPRSRLNGAAPESNRPSVGLPRRTGFEDRLGHRARAAPRVRLCQRRSPEYALVADATGQAVAIEPLQEELCRAA